MATKTIYKYPVSYGPFLIKMYKEAEVLCVQMQNDIPQMWALVDLDAEEEDRGFVLVGTGAIFHEFPPNHKYVGTYQEPPFVWHLFEIKS